MAPFPIILGHEGALVCSALNFWAWVQLKCVSLKKSTFAGAGEVESIGEGVRDLKVTIFSSEETQQMPLSLFLEAPTHFLWQERKIMSFDIFRSLKSLKRRPIRPILRKDRILENSPRS